MKNNPLRLILTGVAFGMILLAVLLLPGAAQAKAAASPQGTQALSPNRVGLCPAGSVLYYDSVESYPNNPKCLRPKFTLKDRFAECLGSNPAMFPYKMEGCQKHLAAWIMDKVLIEKTLSATTLLKRRLQNEVDPYAPYQPELTFKSRWKYQLRHQNLPK